MTVKTTAPASGSIFSADPSDFGEAEIAGGTDVVIAVIALGTVEASSRRWDRVGADIALGAICEGNARFVKRFFPGLRPGGHNGGKGSRRNMLCRIRWFVVGGISRFGIRSWEERMCAAFSLIHTSIAITPIPIIADVAFPETFRCKGGTVGAEWAGLETFAGI